VRQTAALRLVVSCVYAVGSAYTQKPVYTRGGTYTHPLCIHTTARVYAPTRVYARPARVYAPPAYTHPCLRIRTHPRIRTLGCVYARTRVVNRTHTRVYTHVRI